MNNYKKSSFTQRLIALIIDLMIVGVIVNLISTPFINQEKNEKLMNETKKIMDNYKNGDISLNVYFNQVKDINYELSRINGITTLIEIVVLILYFIVFQFYNKGQTLGKKIMKIRVINKDSNELTMNNILLRSLIINSILFNMIVLGFITFLSKDMYLYGVYSFQIIQYLIVIISVFMILFGKESIGLHDLIGHTKVVSEK